MAARTQAHFEGQPVRVRSPPLLTLALVAARGKALIIIFIIFTVNKIFLGLQNNIQSTFSVELEPLPEYFFTSIRIMSIDESVRGRWSCKRSLQC